MGSKVSDLNDRPIVSVVVLSYNFKNELRECLDSIVSQATDFPIEIIVGDDASTDGSRELLERYAVQHKNIIPIFHESNVGAQYNLSKAQARASGEFIARIDGDDYMLPGKLQSQKKYFDLHPECVMVAHRCYRQIEKSGNQLYEGHDLPPLGGRSSIEWLCKYGSNITSSSLMYRASALPGKGFPIYKNARSVDILWSMLLASQGGLGLIREPLGVYRVHRRGTNNPRPDDIWRTYYGRRRALQVAKRHGCSRLSYQQSLANIRLGISLKYLKCGDYEKYRKMITLSRKAAHLNGIRQAGGYHLRFLAPTLRMLKPFKELIR